jgi:undecaprenyl-diphosphatase
MPNLFQLMVLALIQGACELLPVSSSAHVIVAEKLMGLDPTSPEMTMLLVMLHTGTMGAVIVYFWRDWNRNYFAAPEKMQPFLLQVAAATVCTGVVGFGLQLVIKKIFLRGAPGADIESLFSNLPLMAGALAAVGVFIIFAGSRAARAVTPVELTPRQACWIGIIQGLCLPFRGFSRSGSTISAGLLMGQPRQRVEEFSFALAVVLTPVVIAREGYRLLKAHAFNAGSQALDLFMPGLLGLGLSFVAGLLALLWLSVWLEGGHWKIFGYYCLVAAGGVLAVHFLMP